MADFSSECELHRAELRVRSAERAVVRQQVVVAKFEAVDDLDETHLARLYLAVCEQRLQVARDELRGLQAQRARALFRVVRK